jgi:hypothetical protein
MLPFLEFFELQIVGVWAVCFLIGFYLSVAESQ